MINTKQIIISLSLVLMVIGSPVSAMQYREKQERKAGSRRAQRNNVNRKKEIAVEIKEAKFVVPNMQPEAVIEVVSVENLPEQPVAQISEASHSGAIVLYKDSSEVINVTQKVVKPVVFDVSLACKLAQEMQLSSNRASESLFASIVTENQSPSLSSAPKQNLSPASFTPEIINLGQSIAQAIEEEGILRDKDGNIIAQVTDADDLIAEIFKAIFQEKAVVNNPLVEEIPVDNGPVVAEKFIPNVAATHSLKAFSKPVIFGLLGVCGITALGWKLYQKTSHYQCGLLQKWQMQVADAITAITSGVKDNKQILPIEFSQLTRLTDVEREQLAQAHDSLVVAFDKVQQTVAQAATDDLAHTPVVKELKVAHAQWDNVMNNCKNVVEQGSMRFW